MGCCSSTSPNKGDKLHQHSQNQLIQNENKNKNLPGETKLAPAHESKQELVTTSDKV